MCFSTVERRSEATALEDGRGCASTAKVSDMADQDGMEAPDLEDEGKWEAQQQEEEQGVMRMRSRRRNKRFIQNSGERIMNRTSGFMKGAIQKEDTNDNYGDAGEEEEKGI